MDREDTETLIEAKIGHHEKDCREGCGPIAELRKSVGKLNAIVTAFGILFMLLQAATLMATLAKSAKEIVGVGTAKAEEQRMRTER